MRDDRAEADPKGGAPVSIIALRKTFGRVVALEQASLDIGKGEFVSLLGASGSGKSTLLKLIAGLERSSSGRLLIDGVDTTQMPAEQRGIGMVFQDYALFPTMSVFDNIAFPLKMRKVSAPDIARRVKAVVDMLGIHELVERRPQQLSGGQQQRVAIARAIVFSPKILLLDEPLSALDKQLREHTKTEIKALHERLGLTIIYVTHDQSEALAMSDRIAIMDKGRIVDIDTPSGLYTRPRSQFIASFVGQANLLPVTVTGLSATEFAVASPWGSFKSGSERAFLGEAPAVGMAALAVFRPEHCDIGPVEAAPGRVMVQTQVIQPLYNGSETIYSARCPASGMGLYLRDVRPGARVHQAGETMPVSVDLTQAVLVRDDRPPT